MIMKKHTINEQVSRIKNMMGLNEATDEEVRDYNHKIRNSYKVTDYLNKLYSHDEISREVYHDFRNALNDVLKRYHEEINGRGEEMDSSRDIPGFEGMMDDLDNLTIRK
jgi:hypothetical protein